MKVFMTNGTLKFLEKLVDKHPEITLFFMNNTRGTLAYYEGSKKGIFSAGREYDAIIMSGSLSESGYVVINNIPIPGESQPLFEDHFNQAKQLFNGIEGFQSFRLLKPKRGDMYAVLTQWKSAKDYEKGKNSAEFKRALHQESIKQPAYFANRSFTNTYSMLTKEDE